MFEHSVFNKVLWGASRGPGFEWRSPEAIAVFANTAGTLIFPGVLFQIWSHLSPLPIGATVHASVPWPGLREFVEYWVAPAVPFLPLLPLVAWRTWVHARNIVVAGATGLQGVVEGGVVGFVLVAIPLMIGVLPHGISQPLLSSEYVLFYSLFGMATGLGVSLVLWLIGILALKLSNLIGWHAA